MEAPEAPVACCTVDEPRKDLAWAWKRTKHVVLIDGDEVRLHQLANEHDRLDLKWRWADTEGWFYLEACPLEEGLGTRVLVEGEVGDDVS